MTPDLSSSGTFKIGGERTVTRLGFGAMRMTGPDIIGPPADESTAIAVAKRALKAGVDLVDTADSYGPGTSERLLRTAGVPDRALVATKAGLLRNRDGDWRPHGDPDYIKNQALCSVDRLGIDSIDLYQFHRPDPDTPFEDSVKAFAELKDADEVDHVGLSNVSVEQLETARELVDIATVQNRYNVADREHEDVLDACEDYDIGFIPYFPIGGGSIDERGSDLRAIAAAHDATWRQVALAWLLQHSSVILPIPGTSRLDHLEENLGAAELVLTPDEMARLS